MCASRFEALGDSNPDILVKLSVILAGAESESEVDDEGRELLGKFESLQAEGDKEIGLAFKLGLMRDLPPRLENLEMCFSDVPRLRSRNVQIALLKSPACRAAGKKLVSPLVARGLTPVSIFEASESIPA
jgi:hypothetical protein